MSRKVHTANTKINKSEQKETFHRETCEPLKLGYNQRKKLENIKHIKTFKNLHIDAQIKRKVAASQPKNFVFKCDYKKSDTKH